MEGPRFHNENHFNYLKQDYSSLKLIHIEACTAIKTIEACVEYKVLTSVCLLCY